MDKPKYGSPTGKVTYDDSSVSGKTYVQEDTRRHQHTPADLPFDESFMKQALGSRKLNPKMKFESEVQHAVAPVTDESGKRWHAHFFDVQYKVPGMPLVAKGDGSVGKGSMPFMMAPGMQRGKGEFAPHQVPPDQMARKQSDFSFFTPIEDPHKK